MFDGWLIIFLGGTVCGFLIRMAFFEKVHLRGWDGLNVFQKRADREKE